MRSKNKILYFNITLFVLASLFAINTFSVRGHNLIRNVLAVTDKITGEGTVNYLTRFAGGANPSNQIGDSIIYDDGGGPINGKIGIGTTGPAEKLDVAGSIRANGAIYSMTPGGYGQTVLYQWGLGSSGTIYIEPAAGNHLYLTDSWSGTGTLQSRFAYAQFMNGNSSAYTPIYASDYYSSAAGGIWMSQLCRSNGTNCPAAGNLSGSGTTNYLPIFTGASSLGNSTISDNGSYYTINSRSLYVPSGWVIASDLRSRSGYIYAGGSDWEVIRGNDSWLRLNQGGQFASGVYTPGYLRVDGGVGVVGGNLTVDAGYVYAYNNSYPIRLGELWGHTGLYNGSSSQIMYFASDQYFNFLNRSGNYGPGVYAADFYSNTAGVWMSQLCRSNGTNCPAAGDFVPKNTWWGSTYTGSDGNIYLGFWGKWLSTDLSERATHRAEGTNFVDYSRYVYNNGAYSGSGWIEPSDLGVRYASSAGNSDTTDGYHLNQAVTNGASPTFGNLYLTGVVSTIQGYSPANSAIRMTPNFHLNSVGGFAVILNWDNGTTGATQTFRVGNGAGSDAFYVLANGQTYVGGNLTVAGTAYANGQALCQANGTNCLAQSTNADTVDGLHAASFLRKDVSDTIAGGTANYFNTGNWTGGAGGSQGKIQYH